MGLNSSRLNYFFTLAVYVAALSRNCCAEDDYVSSACRPGTDRGSRELLPCTRH